MSVFDGKLNQVFQLQARITRFCDEIREMKIADGELNIVLDCTRELQEIKPRIEGVLRACIFDYKGTFGQDTYNRIRDELDNRIVELNSVLASCESIAYAFANKKTDYQSYLSYLQFHQTSKSSFKNFQGQVVNYLTRSLQEKAPDILEKAAKEISMIEFDQNPISFELGFASKREQAQNSIVNHSIENENRINVVRTKVSDEVVERFQGAASPTMTTTNSLSDTGNELAEVGERIEALLRNWEDSLLRNEYQRSYQKLKESQSLAEPYFFRELHDSIVDKRNTGRIKDKINGFVADLNNLGVHPSLKVEKQSVLAMCISSINSSSANEREFENLSVKVDDFIRRNSKLKEQDEIKRKENLFLKSQVIVCLENLGYEVMDDLTVIDFELENDFLLKVHQQDNYLNLKFKEDGSMRYVFQIPEDPDGLNTDQRNMKLHEMEVTCGEFKSVLNDLAKMGLNVELRSERPIENASIISVPANKREKIKSKPGRKDQRLTVRKRYMNV